MLPSIDPTEVGATGLFWLLLSYGYILYVSSKLIAEGSDLLLLVPSVAGIVGSVILPILGAVPDGAIMLFSGLGPIAEAQETLSVGVGALAGSTIMLLTVPWCLSVFAGRVDIEDGAPRYNKTPKLAPNKTVFHALFHTGVKIAHEARVGALIMMATTLPYFIIQIPASFLHGPPQVIAAGEKTWALLGFLVCVAGFVSYLILQVKSAERGDDKLKRVEVMRKLIAEGTVSLTGAMRDTMLQEMKKNPDEGSQVALKSGYQSIADTPWPSKEMSDYMKPLLSEAFAKYDKDGNKELDKSEFATFLKDFNEDISPEDYHILFDKVDKDNDGTISFDEFMDACYFLILANLRKAESITVAADPENLSASIVECTVRDIDVGEDGDESDEEAEDVPKKMANLSPEKQQAAIIKSALLQLSLGTALVLIFSDPMVDIMSEISARAGLKPFYVSFCLAPIASNASELIASMFYASKKTRKSMAVSISALEGAACMNNTFCLSIFMGLIYFRGLAWQYSAETISIVVVQVVLGVFVQFRTYMTAWHSLLILSMFPLSLLLVAFLEGLGFD